MANGKFDLTKTLGESSYIYSRCEWSSSGKTETNKSTINIKVIVGKKSGSNTPTTCTFNTNVSVSGAEYPSSQSSSPYDSVSANEEITVFSGIFVIPHDDNGKKSTTINVSIGNNNVYHASGSSTITLDTIPRASSIAVSNYDLGQNISITIGKKVDSFTSTLTYKIGSRTGTIVEKTKEPSCVWEMSEELISQIKQDNPKNAKPTATIYCETYSGDTKIGDTKSATFDLYIIDKPKLASISTEEARLDIQALTVSVLKHVSIINVNAEAEAPEGTTISNYKLKWGNIEKNSSDGIFLIDNIQYSYLDENGNRKTKFTVIATDERGNSSDGFFSSEEYPYTCDFIEYIQLAFNNTDIKLTRLNGTSNYIKLHMTGYVYNGLFGETQNTLTIKYRYKLKNDSTAKWSELKTVPVTLNEDNTFIVDNLQLEDEFDYRENYDIEFYADDLFSTSFYFTVIKTSETIVKVHKNGIDVKNLTIRGNEIYPIGSIYMSVNDINPGTLFGGVWEQLKDRFLLGAGDTYKEGNMGGEATHTLSIREMPSHTHDVYNENGGGYNLTVYTAINGEKKGYPNNIVTTSAGEGQAHNNMPPYLVVYMWKRIS